MSLKLKSSLMLLLTSFIWGTAFVAQSIGMDYIGPHTYVGIRYIIGCIVLLPLIAYRAKHGQDQTKRNASETSPEQARRITLIGGICCGVALFIASLTQQIGLTGTDAGKAGFITALYIVLVPVFGLLLGRKITPIMAFSVALAVVGLYLLCVNNGFSLATTDLYLLACAFLFTMQILLVDHFSPLVDPVRLSCLQFLVAGILGCICMFIFEEPDINAILACSGSILYAGVLSSGVAYTLQIVAQAHLAPTSASLLMSFESVFSAISGAVVLGETMTAREGMGCVIMFCAVLLSQLGDVAITRIKQQKKSA